MSTRTDPSIALSVAVISSSFSNMFARSSIDVNWRMTGTPFPSFCSAKSSGNFRACSTNNRYFLQVEITAQCTLVQPKIISFRKSKNRNWNIEEYPLISCFGHSGLPKNASFFPLVHNIKLRSWLKVEKKCKKCQK